MRTIDLVRAVETDHGDIQPRWTLVDVARIAADLGAKAAGAVTENIAAAQSRFVDCDDTRWGLLTEACGVAGVPWLPDAMLSLPEPEDRAMWDGTIPEQRTPEGEQMWLDGMAVGG